MAEGRVRTGPRRTREAGAVYACGLRVSEARLLRLGDVTMALTDQVTAAVTRLQAITSG